MMQGRGVRPGKEPIALAGRHDLGCPGQAKCHVKAALQDICGACVATGGGDGSSCHSACESNTPILVACAGMMVPMICWNIKRIKKGGFNGPCGFAKGIASVFTLCR